MRVENRNKIFNDIEMSIDEIIEVEQQDITTPETKMDLVRRKKTLKYYDSVFKNRFVSWIEVGNKDSIIITSGLIKEIKRNCNTTSLNGLNDLLDIGNYDVHKLSNGSTVRGIKTTTSEFIINIFNF